MTLGVCICVSTQLHENNAARAADLTVTMTPPLSLLCYVHAAADPQLPGRWTSGNVLLLVEVGDATETPY